MLTDLPNLLTLSRIAAIPVVVGLIAVHAPWADLAACALFTAAAITDWLDGRIARGRRLFSDLGRMLDSIADKLLVGAVLIALAGEQRLPGITLYAGIVILMREILVSGLREHLAERRVGLPATRLAKWKTTVQLVALGLLLAGDATARLLGIPWLPVTGLGVACLWLAALLTLVTGWDYLATGLRHIRPAPRPNGLPR